MQPSPLPLQPRTLAISRATEGFSASTNVFAKVITAKLNFYVNAVDELLKQDEDNPTIGLLICSDLNKTEVQWSFHGISTPMGVATYNNIKIKDILPSQELLKERVELLQKELKEAKRIIQKNDNKTRKHE